MNFLVLNLYKFILLPTVYVILQCVRPFASGKLRELLDDKNNKKFVLNKNQSLENIASQKPIWIHAASGEIEYARSFIRELKQRRPGIPILVTYSSPSAKKILAELEIDAWAALPWDFSFCFNSFIKKWTPRALFISRTDLWPLMADAVKRHALPAFLFSATFADNSSRLKGLTRYLTSDSLNKISGIFCVSTEDAQNLIPLQIRTPVQVIGDTRFDQVFYRLEHPKTIKTSLKPAEDQWTIVLGSTWPEDEAVLLPAMNALKSENCRFILAPHEAKPSHLEYLLAEFEKNGLSVQLYSSSNEMTFNADVLLIDQVGVLAEIYTWGKLAFVGGSFRKQVHSVMEPLAVGLPVLVGPFHRNNREALVYQKKFVTALPIVQCISSSEEFVQRVRALRQKNASEMKSQILLEVHKNLGSTQKLFNAVEKILMSH